jgi:hypothetical protein
MGWRGPSIFGLSCIVSALVLGGCAGDDKSPGLLRPASTPRASSMPSRSTTQPPVTLPAGYRLTESSRLGFRLAVPDGWTEIDVSRDDMSDAIQRAGLDDARADVVASLLQRLRGFEGLVWADFSSAETTFVTEAKAACADIPRTSIDDLERYTRLAAAAVGADNVSVETVLLDDREAVRVSYDLKTTVYDVRGTQYMWGAGDGRACTLTLTTDRPDEYRESFEGIVSTVDFDP